MSVGLPHMSLSSSLASVVLSCVHIEARPEISAEASQRLRRLAFPLPDVQDLVALTLAAQVPSQILTGVAAPGRWEAARAQAHPCADAKVLSSALPPPRFRARLAGGPQWPSVVVALPRTGSLSPMHVRPAARVAPAVPQAAGMLARLLAHFCAGVRLVVVAARFSRWPSAWCLRLDFVF